MRERPRGESEERDPGRWQARVPQAPDPSLERFKRSIIDACEREDRWERKVIAAIEAGLRFPSVDPASAYEVLVRARRRRLHDGANPQEELIDHFAESLARIAPARRRDSPSEKALVEAVATVARVSVLTRTPEAAVEQAPDLVWLTLLPYLGRDGADRWAETVAS
jgi:hypothetical protein